MRLSGPMQRGWESGYFWIIYAVTHSFAFDAIYWQKIDPRFFGPTSTENPDEAWKERLELLDEKEKEEMDELVARKLKETETRILAWDPDEYTEAFRQKLREWREKENEGKAKVDQTDRPKALRN
ncbi:Phosphotransferase enzyme family [Aspergillus sp. HF37]|nr:Phosphotransferase enzyme family [Aspergillus sp. HF37]